MKQGDVIGPLDKVRISFVLHRLIAGGPFGRRWVDFPGLKFLDEGKARQELDDIRLNTKATWRLVKITEEVIG